MVIDTQAAENGHQFGVFCHSKSEWIFGGNDFAVYTPAFKGTTFIGCGFNNSIRFAVGLLDDGDGAKGFAFGSNGELIKWFRLKIFELTPT